MNAQELLWAAGFAIAMYVIGWFVLPIQKYTKSIGNKSGNNTAFKAYAHPNARYPMAVMAQEVYEARAKYRLIDVFRKSRYQRQVEGAEVTVQAAKIMHGVWDDTSHRAQKARDFVNFKHEMLPDRDASLYKDSDENNIPRIEREAELVEIDMLHFKVKARKWVERNLKLIERA